MYCICVPEEEFVCVIVAKVNVQTERDTFDDMKERNVCSRIA